jgi:hypothetical protein
VYKPAPALTLLDVCLAAGRLSLPSFFICCAVELSASECVEQAQLQVVAAVLLVVQQAVGRASAAGGEAQLLLVSILGNSSSSSMRSKATYGVSTV